MTTSDAPDSPDYPLTAEMLAAMLRVTRITSPAMQQALHDHLVAGDTLTAAAERHDYAKQQLGVHARLIRDKIKPAFDAYASLARAPRKRRS
ncbi:hypothetical protein [Cupriavidus sp. TMH.W2]|uniref:hypothetical protein n=1 Tax=Cupriavidus sp. TMH.W2 TaxID=3434465 RepID=UPI003D784EEA